MDEFHQISSQYIHNHVRSIHIYIGLWLNGRKAKQTLWINWILGMDDDIGELDILVFPSVYKWCPCVVLCFLVFHLPIYLNVFCLKCKCYYYSYKWERNLLTHWVPILEERSWSMELVSWTIWNMDSRMKRHWIDSMINHCLLILSNTFPNRGLSLLIIDIWLKVVRHIMIWFVTTTDM